MRLLDDFEQSAEDKNGGKTNKKYLWAEADGLELTWSLRGCGKREAALELPHLSHFNHT
jgi:hypothetical protein